MLVRRRLEVCVFSYLAAELRPGDIAVAGSDSYANLHDQLMSWEECRPLVEAFCAQAGIPSGPTALAAPTTGPGSPRSPPGWTPGTRPTPAAKPQADQTPSPLERRPHPP
jgi:hypothetical protein